MPTCAEILKAAFLNEKKDQFNLLELLVRVGVFTNSFKCNKCSMSMFLKPKPTDNDGFEVI